MSESQATSAASSAAPGPERSSAVSFGLLFAALLVLAYATYTPAIDGEFVSDDHQYLTTNPYVQVLSAEHLLAILDPTSAVPLIAENYAPVHLILHALEWQVFGRAVRGYHLFNLVVHALGTCLLVELFRRSGVPARAAVLGGAFFLVHPANVEAVAWISQLKTTSAFALALAALIAQPRRPVLGTLLFALSLLAKATASVALFALAVLIFSRSDAGASAASGGERTRWKWLSLWAAIFAAVSAAEILAFATTTRSHLEIYPELSTRILSTLAIAGRYLVMATTSSGLSTFHEPAATTSFADPWLAGALVAIFLIGWRTFVVLRARRVEAVFWVWAIVSWAPTSGLISLPFPLADRYLYFVLPGLIGGVLLAGADLAGWARARWPSRQDRRIAQVVTALAVVWILVFTWRAHERAFVWQSAKTVADDAERNYPEGSSARLSEAIRAAQSGDAETAVAALREAHARGYERLDALLSPRFENIRDEPAFVALKREWAHEWVQKYSIGERPKQPQLMMLAQAYITLGELELARGTLLRAIYAEGPMTAYLQGALRQLDALERAQRGGH